MNPRMLLAAGLAAAGGYYVYRCFVKGQCDIAPQWADLPDPAVEENPVDEASWESFPASDPPSFSVSRSAAS